MYKIFKAVKLIATNFAIFIDTNHWIRSSDDLWYQKSDGNPNEGITTDDLFEIFRGKEIDIININSNENKETE